MGAAGRRLCLRFAAKNIPHPNKAHYGGEDAWFVSDVAASAGIADGVGGWQEAGVNPADYSRALMATARQYLEECATLYPDVTSSAEWLAAQPGAAEFAAAAERQARMARAAVSVDEEEGGMGPRPPAAPLVTSSVDGPRTAVEALDVAHRSTRLPGSATACVVRLRQDGRDGRAVLDAANLGDSGFLIVRAGRLHFQTPAMQHFFDCPLQFGMPPDTDYAEDAAVFELEVQPGDAIVMATDGLLDNLYPEDILRLAPRSADGVEAAAAALAAAAAANAADPEFESPYTREALEEGLDLPIWEKLLSSSFKVRGGWERGLHAREGTGQTARGTATSCAAQQPGANPCLPLAPTPPRPCLPLLHMQDGKFELGKLRGGKMDDITVIVAYVDADSAAPAAAAEAA